MSTPVFDYLPSVELLQVLARGSLKQNLPKALRLWVILRSLYGDEADEARLGLGEEFSYEDWRDEFFTQTKKIDEHDIVYHRRDEIPSKHDPKCRCAKTLADWLFKSSLSIGKDEWMKSFQRLYSIEFNDLESLLRLGIIPKQGKTQKQPQLAEYRLFGVTGRLLQYDFENLVEMGWLQFQLDKNGKPQRRQFCKVLEFPDLAISNPNAVRIEGIEFLDAELAEIAINYHQKINGIQRFFIHTEYVVSKTARDRIGMLQDQLKQIWQKTPVPPVRLTYDSASLWREGQRIVYPVCIYYYQRAPYLCAYGQTPKERKQMGWYNYRLDRIGELSDLEWSDEAVPPELRKECQKENSLSPDRIKWHLTEALGFDFYQDKALMLLRFNRDFHDRYIQNTIRHDTFKSIAPSAAANLIKKSGQTSEQQKFLLDILQRFPNDAYYQVYYRIDDNNVIMRLRAWGAKVEVLLPEDLRQRIAADAREIWELYQ